MLDQLGHLALQLAVLSTQLAVLAVLQGTTHTLV
jgi:hypothetical protein